MDEESGELMNQQGKRQVQVKASQRWRNWYGVDTERETS